MARNNFTRIYEVNDLFAVMGYSLFTLGLISWLNTAGITNLTVQVIPVDSILDVFKGLFNFSAVGNIVSLISGFVAVCSEKYIKYGRFI